MKTQTPLNLVPEFEVWFDDTKTLSPKELEELEKELPPIPEERIRRAKKKIDEICRELNI